MGAVEEFCRGEDYGLVIDGKVHKDYSQLLGGLTVEKVFYDDESSKYTIVFAEEDEDGYKRTLVTHSINVEDVPTEYCR